MKIQGIVTTAVLTLALIIISITTATALSCGDCNICVNQSGWWRDNGALNASGAPIQAAVDNATEGETICVAAGSYTENVDITTSNLTLAGEGADVVTVTAASSSDHVFEVTADYVNISGFTATRATGSYKVGIYLDGADHCDIYENNASNNDIGIWLDDSSNDNTLANNTANSNGWIGIWLDDSSNNTLTSNTANSNSGGDSYGICLYRSSNNTLTGNTASNNDVGIWLDDSSNNTLTGNTASNNDGGIILYDLSNDNTLTNNTASNNDFGGILLGYSSSNTLTNNTASSNTQWDIYIQSSDSTFTNNTLNGTTISFTYGGDVSLKGVGSPATDPAGQHTIGKFINATNQSADAWLSLNFSYSDADVGDLVESDLKVWKHNGTMWLEDGWNGTRYLDTAGNVVGVNITSFSIFAPAAPELLDDTTPPVITITTPEPDVIYTVGMTLDFCATDDESDVHTVVGDLTNTSGVSQNVSTSFEPVVGVYTLVVTANDTIGNKNVSDPVFFVVYDPAGGSATGEGWFDPDDESTLSKAEFEFAVKYKKDVSTGNLNFKDEDAEIKLKSTSIDWLVISNVSAQFQGTGTIKGEEGLYTFRVQADDYGEPGVGSDHFDIKIWDGTDTVADPDYEANNTIAEGNIQVHTK